MRTTFIYGLKCPVTNLIRYIGKADNPQRRLKQHVRRCRETPSRKNSWIQGLLLKEIMPILEIINEVSVDEWEKWERHYIEYYKSIQYPLVNMTIGGDNPPINTRKGYKISPELSARLSLLRIGNKNSLGHRHSKETKERMSMPHKGQPAPNRGIPHSEETKKRIGLKSAGRPNGMSGKQHTDQAKQQMSKIRMGKQLSDKTTLRMSIVKTGSVLSAKTKQKISESHTGTKNPFYGRTHSEETKEKMRQAKLRRFK